MAKYNGHKNWNHWNVALWFANDESLYRMALRAIRRAGNRDQAARDLLRELADADMTVTPDGARYTLTAVRAALVGLE